MELILIIVLIIGVGIVAAIHQDKQRKKLVQDVTSKCKESGLEVSQIFIGDNRKSGIVLDESNKKICLIDKTLSGLIFRTISYHDILSSEIIEDGINIVKTSRSSQVGGALIGGILLGGAGAVIGGLSGSKSSSTEKVKKIELHIIVNDTKQPRHVLSFLGHETKKSGLGKFTYNNAIESARHWHSLISVLIRQADNDDMANEKEIAATVDHPETNNSVADEIGKLANLLDRNLITESEFREQKTKLLAKA
jgi:hypothetical protein